jgi:hypothetical protein
MIENDPTHSQSILRNPLCMVRLKNTIGLCLMQHKNNEATKHVTDQRAHSNEFIAACRSTVSAWGRMCNERWQQ